MLIPEHYEVVDFTKTMFFDLDAPSGNPELAKEDYRELVRYLIDVDGSDDVSVFDTGNGGYHVFFPWDTPCGVEVAKSIASACCHYGQLSTLDLSVYREGQIVLKEGCPNRKTGVIKRKMTLNEILK